VAGSAAGRADALQWLFFLSQHIMPAAARSPCAYAPKSSDPLDEATVARARRRCPRLAVLEGQLAKNRWLLGPEFSLVDCGYCPVLNVIEKAGFSLAGVPKTSAYLDAAAPARLAADAETARALAPEPGSPLSGQRATTRGRGAGRVPEHRHHADEAEE